MIGGLRRAVAAAADFEQEMLRLRAVCNEGQAELAVTLLDRIAPLGPSARRDVLRVIREHVTRTGYVSMTVGQCWTAADALAVAAPSFDRDGTRSAYFRELMVANGHLIPRLHVDGCARQRGESSTCTCPRQTLPCGWPGDNRRSDR